MSFLSQLSDAVKEFKRYHKHICCVCGKKIEGNALHSVASFNMMHEDCLNAQSIKN